MAQFRRMEEDEVAAMQPRPRKEGSDRRKTIAQNYRASLQSYGPGDWVEVNLDPDDNRDTVKARLKRAADALGLKLMFKRTRGERLRFQIQ